MCKIKIKKSCLFLIFEVPLIETDTKPKLRSWSINEHSSNCSLHKWIKKKQVDLHPDTQPSRQVSSAPSTTETSPERERETCSWFIRLVLQERSRNTSRWSSSSCSSLMVSAEHQGGHQPAGRWYLLEKTTRTRQVPLGNSLKTVIKLKSCSLTNWFKYLLRRLGGLFKSNWKIVTLAGNLRLT